MSRSYIKHDEATCRLPKWMVAVAQAFDYLIESWVPLDYPAFRERAPTVSVQSWALIHGTMVRDSDCNGELLLQVFASHPVVGNIVGWPCELLTVHKQPWCSLPVLAVPAVQDVRVLWLYDRQPQRIIVVAEGHRSIAVLVASKVARTQEDDTLGHMTEVLLSLAEGQDNLDADPPNILNALGMEPAVKARSGGQPVVIASAPSSGPAAMDVVGRSRKTRVWSFWRGANRHLG